MKSAAFLLAITATFAPAQGPLTPPGAPAPTMKTLAQIEARTPINASQIISQPGSYYLTSDIAGGLSIQANDVTLDLNGFTVRVGLGDGIGISSGNPRTNVTIRNGSIVGSGLTTFTGPVAGSYAGNSGRGVIAYGHTPGNTSAQNLRIENVSVRGFEQGIVLASFGERDGGRHTISNCMVRLNGADGIRGVNSTISMCKSSGNDTNTADGYPAAGIVWAGGRQVDNVCDLYAPAAPAP